MDSHSAISNEGPKEEVVNSKHHATECSLESPCFRIACPLSSEADDCKRQMDRAEHGSALTPTIQQASHHHLHQSQSTAEAPESLGLTAYRSTVTLASYQTSLLLFPYL